MNSAIPGSFPLMYSGFAPMTALMHSTTLFLTPPSSLVAIKERFSRRLLTWGIKEFGKVVEEYRVMMSRVGFSTPGVVWGLRRDMQLGIIAFRGAPRVGDSRPVSTEVGVGEERRFERVTISSGQVARGIIFDSDTSVEIVVVAPFLMGWKGEDRRKRRRVFISGIADWERTAGWEA
eukprot:CAMPEP_0118667244 /NCGR_PEP_ID=MMETSP0785-20121206/19676_1 /TAXON_ID=91992 /ORGANISM="Bolidomonas pacifica, Strain CCMP 1866" /LENGTH=176 /DNA_ID=CAMNT_0006561671 /DNA_START=207 /DNA_END=733 /DNA_ORIENTATION=+